MVVCPYISTSSRLDVWTADACCLYSNFVEPLYAKNNKKFFFSRFYCVLTRFEQYTYNIYMLSFYINMYRWCRRDDVVAFKLLQSCLCSAVETGGRHRVRRCQEKVYIYIYNHFVVPHCNGKFEGRFLFVVRLAVKTSSLTTGCTAGSLNFIDLRRFLFVQASFSWRIS